MATAKAQAPLLGAYLMVGTDDLKKKTALAHLEKRLAASGEPEFNMDVVDGSEQPDAGALRSSLDTLPFGGDFRLVVVRDVDKAPKAVTEAIVSYLKNPSPTTVLAMTATKVAANTRLYKAVAAVGPKAVMDCAPKKRRELPAQVAKMAAAHGKAIAPDAAEELIRLVGESTTMLDAELGKLAVALGPGVGAITAQDVTRLVTRVAEVQPWDFLDAVCRRNPAEAMQMLNRMPSQSVIGLFTLTIRRLRELICAKALERRGCAGQLASELKLQSWQVKNHVAWARNYSMAELVGALRTGAQCDADLKSLPDKTLTFQRWVLSFCARG